MQSTHNLHLVYSTINDAPSLGPLTDEYIFLIVSLCTSLILIIWGKKIRATFPDFNLGKLLVITLFGTVFLTAIILGTRHLVMNQYDHDKALYNSNKLLFVEGRVTNFYPMSADGHGYEEFVVNGVDFHYSMYVIGQGGYNKTARDGGVIKPDLYVRIGYYYNEDLIRNVILKLETE